MKKPQNRSRRADFSLPDTEKTSSARTKVRPTVLQLLKFEPAQGFILRKPQSRVF